MAIDHDLDRMLRTTLVYNFLIALCLGIPAGTSGPTIIVPMALIPAAFSAVLGLVGAGGRLKNRCVAIPLDSVLLAAYISLLVPTWVKLANCHEYRGMRCGAGGMMLATYATVPIMINLVIHSYCVVRHLPLTVAPSTAVCPNCHHEHEARNKFFHAPSTIYARSAIPSTIYTPDDDEEESLVRDYDDTAVLRGASSEIDGSTLYAGEGRQPLLNQPPTYEAVGPSDRKL